MRWKWLGLSVRAVKGLVNGLNFLWLALPLVSLQVCGTTIAQRTGYEALQGGLVVPEDMSTPVGPVATYGQDWWVIGIAVFAIVGIGAAIRGGLLGAAIGLGSAILGLIALWASLSFYSPPASSQLGWSPNAADGGTAIGLSFFSTGMLDLGYMTVHSWYEVRRDKQSPNRGDWIALRIGSTFFFGVLALGAILVGWIDLSTKGN